MFEVGSKQELMTDAAFLPAFPNVEMLTRITAIITVLRRDPVCQLKNRHVLLISSIVSIGVGLYTVWFRRLDGTDTIMNRTVSYKYPIISDAFDNCRWV